MRSSRIGIRWTMGDVSDRGFEALRLSIWGAWRLFGREARYLVCVNTVPVDLVRFKTGEVPRSVEWRDSTGDMPELLRVRLGAGMAEGVGWKLAPLRAFPEMREISIDNDCILWSLPEAMEAWLERGEGDRCLMAEDVRACFGQFAGQCGPEPRNAGMRGLPPGFDFEAALLDVLHETESRLGRSMNLASELDEQGLQTAALSRNGPPMAVSLRDVTICSPFPPHLPELGRCGAHFCGLNSRHIPWNYYERPADECIEEHWQRHRPTLYRNVAPPGTSDRSYGAMEHEASAGHRS